MDDFTGADWTRTIVTAALAAAALIGFLGQGERNHYTHDAIDRVGAVCEDGSRSDATGRGACSRQGGVDYWLTEYEDALGVHRGRSSLPDWAAYGGPADPLIENYGLFVIAALVMLAITGSNVKGRRDAEAREARAG